MAGENKEWVGGLKLVVEAQPVQLNAAPAHPSQLGRTTVLTVSTATTGSPRHGGLGRNFPSRKRKHLRHKKITFSSYLVNEALHITSLRALAYAERMLRMATPPPPAVAAPPPIGMLRWAGTYVQPALPTAGRTQVPSQRHAAPGAPRRHRARTHAVRPTECNTEIERG